jgi:hypothetical protein
VTVVCTSFQEWCGLGWSLQTLIPGETPIHPPSSEGAKVEALWEDGIHNDLLLHHCIYSMPFALLGE